jgi:uncharacterized protein
MEYVSLGKTGERVSRIAFGGATAGIPNYIRKFDAASKDDREPVIEAIRYAHGAGINFFDTAHSYGDGASERIFGEALEPFDPKTYFLATKIGKFDVETAERILEKSLRNLRRDYVDILQIHSSNIQDTDVDLITKRGGLLDLLRRLKEQRVCRHIGFTAEAQNPALYRLIECEAFDTMQILYNLMFQHPYDAYFKSGSLYQASKRGLGILTMRSTTSGIFQRWIKLANPASTFDYTRALIQFQLSCPLVHVCIIGMRTVDEVRQNIETLADTSGRIDISALHNTMV